MTTTVTRRVPPQRLINLMNPLVRTMLRSRAHRPLDDSLLLLHITGRRTGRIYDIPVGYVQLDDRLLVVTQHAWRANLRGGADLEVTLGGHRRPMHAELDRDPHSVAAAILEVIDCCGVDDAQRRLGLAFHPEQVPALAELEDGARRCGLATIALTAR
jgi:F420H(2)-dependent quinone reductase